MSIGDFYCGRIRVAYTGEPAPVVSPCPSLPPVLSHPDHSKTDTSQALCHCTSYHRLFGSLFSHNIIFPAANFHITSAEDALKEIVKVANSENRIVNCFCTECGTMIFRWGDGFGGKGEGVLGWCGVLDDTEVSEVARVE
jgi:hypothetical protein